MGKPKKRVEFKLIAPEAEQVVLSGTFNDWSESSDPMKKDKVGGWKKVKMLDQGTHEYKFIVDGRWILDAECDQTVPNHFGSLNNVLKV